MQQTIWDKETGKALSVEQVDAREILAGPDSRYTAERPVGVEAEQVKEPEPAKPDGNAPNLQAFTVSQLRKLANDVKADIDGLSRKEDLIAAIEMAQADAATS